MNNDQKHELGKEAVKTVNELSSDKFKVIVTGREDAILVAEKIIEIMERIETSEDDIPDYWP